MSKFIFFFLFGIFTLNGFSQYLPMLVDERTWYTRLDGQLGTTTQVLSIDLDSVNNNIRYAHLVEKDEALQIIDTVAFLLEDTLAGSVFIDHIDNSVYDQFYDFSLQLDDTLFFKSPFSGDTARVKVDSVFTFTDMLGTNRKGMRLSSFQGDSCVSTPQFWIEGFGNTAFLQYPQPECSFVTEVFAVLQCVFDGNTKIYGDTISQCYKISLEEYTEGKFEIFPNPVRELLYIEHQFHDPNALKIALYTTNGMKVKEVISSAQKFSVGIEDLSPGIYIMKAVKDDEEIQRTKIIVY